MAQTSTVFNFLVDLSDVDRGNYDQLTLKVARHPSETSLYMLARVLAYCLEYRTGLSFSKGLSESDEPALWCHDETGTLTSWIEIGGPTPERLHRASKRCEDVAVYLHRDPRHFLEQCNKVEIFRSSQIRIYLFPPEILAGLESILDRRMVFALSRNDGELYISSANTTLNGKLEQRQIGA